METNNYSVAFKESEFLLPEEWENLSPAEKKQQDNTRYILETLEPDEAKRSKILSSLHLFLSQEGIKITDFEPANQSMLMASLLRIGVPVSKETVYPRVHSMRGGGQVLIIQDNYLFLQQLILQHLGAEALIVDVIYKKELEYLKANQIHSFAGKSNVIPIYELDSTCNFDGIEFLQIAVLFKDKEPQFKTVYSKTQLLNRLGNALRSSMIWGGRGVDANFHNHSKIEMLKKTAIRAFAKERFGGALEVIRTIDIEQFNQIEHFTKNLRTLEQE